AAPGGLDPGRHRDAHDRADEARDRHGASHHQGQARDLHAAAHDLHARDRLRPRVLVLQRPREGARREELPAGGEPDRLHVQLVLRRFAADRLLQLGLQPRQGVAHGPRPASLRRSRVAQLRACPRAGAHRLDRNGDGRYEHAAALRIMDAWWPLLVRAEFEPVLGRKLFNAVEGMNELSNDPNNHGQHLGSAWQSGWYGYVIKDLRTLLGRKVRGRYSRVYCGRGAPGRCRAALLASLRKALKVDPAKLYSDQVCAAAGLPGDQSCFDSLYFRPLGA